MTVARIMNAAGNKFLSPVLRKFNLKVVRLSRFEEIQKSNKKAHDLEFIKKINGPNVNKIVDMIDHSTAQLRQDLFVINELGFKHGGFFVEFGAGDGKFLSNTYILETCFDWRGILAEPRLSVQSELQRNRSCHVDNRCVWSESGLQLDFVETSIPELSTLKDFQTADMHSNNRRSRVSYRVGTVNINELLDDYGAPSDIDYISIDTEGGEFETLKSIDWSRYSFKIITIEHNWGPQRGHIKELLEEKGYVRKYACVSRFDDWYVRNV